MNTCGLLSFLAIAIIYKTSIVVSTKPSCNEFEGSIKNLDYYPANELTTLVVVKAAQNSPGMIIGQCSLFNNLPNCGSIRISGNIFQNDAITISGWDRNGNFADHYRFNVEHRSESGLHIYDFKPIQTRTISYKDDNGITNRKLMDYEFIPEHIRKRFTFTIALVAANNEGEMTGVGFRFCNMDDSSSNNFFEQSGFVAYDERVGQNYSNIVDAVVANGNGLFSNFVDVPIDKYSSTS